MLFQNNFVHDIQSKNGEAIQNRDFLQTLYFQKQHSIEIIE